jgi:hypothetical protein
MTSWVVVVECDDPVQAKEIADWLYGEFDWPTYVEERN